MKKLPSQELVRKLLRYDSVSGLFTWVDGRGVNRMSGEIAGRKSSNGYIEICIDYIKYAAHRLAWVYVYGKSPDNEIDHINGVRSDNRISNLREATRTENLGNAKIRKDNTSGFRGVIKHDDNKRWRARIRFDNKYMHLGLFSSPAEASCAYQRKADELFGKFKRAI